jgi:flavin-dependent thymidylate synthase
VLFIVLESMKVILAGYNLDSSVIEELKKTAPPRDDITPETLSASYARISRDPRPVDELRAMARAEVDRARRSNRNIIFKMGHHSVAEHAVFNFDIIGISRLVLEEVEKFRLCSYTEKSQRYITLKDDFVIPEEVKNAGLEKIFVNTIKKQNALYQRLYTKLKPYVFTRYPRMAADPKKHPVLDGWAKEDARYVVSLATQGQLGMTLNARNLEFFIRRFSSKKLAEIKELNKKIYELAKEVAPSIILFTESNDFDAKTYEELERKSADFFNQEQKPEDESVRLVSYTPQADERLIAALLHTSTCFSYQACFDKARGLSKGEKEDYLKKAFQYMEFYDFALREFEHVDLTFDLVVSAACFAQLKRHRMATLTTQKYRPELGVTVPPSIREIGERDEFMAVVRRTNDVYDSLRNKLDIGAEYILTNAHRKRILLKVNARELYHMSRLRQDLTAQWDIRNVVERMIQLSENVMPLTCLLIGGKDAYPDIYRRVFGRLPKLEPPKI